MFEMDLLFVNTLYRSSVEHCPKIIVLIKSDSYNYVSMFDANCIIFLDYEKSLTKKKKKWKKVQYHSL